MKKGFKTQVLILKHVWFTDYFKGAFWHFLDHCMQVFIVWRGKKQYEYTN